MDMLTMAVTSNYCYIFSQSTIVQRGYADMLQKV